MPSRQPQGQGPSQRQRRVAELVRQYLAELLLRGGLGDPEVDERMISVVDVSISPDLKIATVYVMPLGGAKDGDPIIKALARHRGVMRKFLAGKLATKFLPDLRFRLEGGFEARDRLEALMRSPQVLQDIGKTPGGDHDQKADQ